MLSHVPIRFENGPFHGQTQFIKDPPLEFKVEHLIGPTRIEMDSDGALAPDPSTVATEVHTYILDKNEFTGEFVYYWVESK